jgi:hypothetical protein
MKVGGGILSQKHVKCATHTAKAALAVTQLQIAQSATTMRPGKALVSVTAMMAGSKIQALIIVQNAITIAGSVNL